MRDTTGFYSYYLSSAVITRMLRIQLALDSTPLIDRAQLLQSEQGEVDVRVKTRWWTFGLLDHWLCAILADSVRKALPPGLKLRSVTLFPRT